MKPINTLAVKIIINKNFVKKMQMLESKAAIKRIYNKILKISQNDIRDYLMQASILAFSDNTYEKHVVQKILAILHENYFEHNLVNYSIQLVSARLGNYPVVSEESQVFKKNNLFKILHDKEKRDFEIDLDIIADLFCEEEKSRPEYFSEFDLKPLVQLLS